MAEQDWDQKCGQPGCGRSKGEHTAKGLRCRWFHKEGPSNVFLPSKRVVWIAIGEYKKGGIYSVCSEVSADDASGRWPGIYGGKILDVFSREIEGES